MRHGYFFGSLANGVTDVFDAQVEWKAYSYSLYEVAECVLGFADCAAQYLEQQIADKGNEYLRPNGVFWSSQESLYL